MTEDELREEAAIQGFYLVPRSSRRVFQASASLDKDILVSSRYPAFEMVRRELAMSMAHRLMDDNALPISEDEIGTTRVSYRARLEIIMPAQNEEDPMLYLGRAR